MTRGRVLFDVQATQSTDHRDRGIARYTAELGIALWRRHASIVHTFLLNPDLAPPGRVEPLIASGRLAYSDRVDVGGAALLHICSPFELSVPISRLWLPEVARRALPLVVTMHDTIPARHRERYLADPGLRARYLARIELVRAARKVLTLSETTAADTIDDFGVPADRVAVIGGAPGRLFEPPASRAGALAAARATVPGLAEHFVLYTGGAHERKNFEGLFRAWSLLAPSIRERQQLLMVCHLDDPTRNHLEHIARGLGILDDLLLTGFVPDLVLRLLYQATDLFVFPSRLEGFGLPIAEALRCGAPTIGSDISAVREFLPADACFDPTDDHAIAKAIENALTHPPPLPVKPLDTWDDVADGTAAAYEEVLARPAPVARRRPLLAVVTPVPPAASGVAAYTFSLVRALRRYADVHVFADGERWVTDAVSAQQRVPDGVALLSLRSFIDDESVRDAYDAVLYCVGNSEFHAGALAALRRRPGVVLAHEARLNDLYALAIDEPGAVPRGFQVSLWEMYGDRLPEHVRALGRLSAELAERFGVLMAREVVALADRFVVMSQFAVDLLRTDVDERDLAKIVTVPFAFPTARADATPASARAPVVATFGVVNEVKQTSLLVEALPLLRIRCPDATLAVVGHCGDEERARLEALADALGVREHLTIASDVSDDEYRTWLDRAAVAVQLRASANGECSAAVTDCVAAGAALVVSNVGSGRELDDAWVYKVETEVGVAELAAAVAELLTDADRRAAMAAAGREHACDATFDAAADALVARAIPQLADRARPADG